MYGIGRKFKAFLLTYTRLINVFASKALKIGEREYLEANGNAISGGFCCRTRRTWVLYNSNLPKPPSKMIYGVSGIWCGAASHMSFMSSGRWSGKPHYREGRRKCASSAEYCPFARKILVISLMKTVVAPKIWNAVTTEIGS